jgi:hypothetical protein
MANHNRFLKPELIDRENGVLQQLFHPIAFRKPRRPRRLSGQPMTTLVQRDQTAVREAVRQTFPVAGIRAEPVKQEDGRLAF